MQKIFGILTDPASGGTFLDWTVQFLSGKNTFYNGRSNKLCWVDLVANPITTRNAHGHRPCQVGNPLTMHDTLINLHKMPADQFHTIYFHSCLDKKNNFNIVNNISAIQSMIQQTEKLIVASSFDRPNLLFNSRKNRFDNEDVIDNLLENYLPEGNQYKNTNWELREFLALSFLHRAPTKLHQLLDRNTEFFRIDTLDLYCSFDNMIESMFCYLNLTIDSTRISSWTNIYNEWKQIHEKSVKWDLNFDKIVEAIVLGKDIELTYYDLDIMQEAAIMQELMTKYNLTIKGYGLEKFPKNTKELHLLLETNFHYEIIRV
jgi:hypothetical protein